MSHLLHRCMTKATTAEGDDIRRSLNWMLSRRGLLKVFDDHLECGDWNIAYSEIEESVLFRTRQMFIPCYVLRIKTHGIVYQFGLNPGKYWSGELPFPAARESAVIGYSWYSIGIRIAAIAAIAYLLWNRWF